MRIGGLKGFVDGSLGSHTAAFLAPFTDAPNDRGLLVNYPDDLRRWIRGADQAGLQVMVHAIGDGRWAETVLGPERAATTYAFRSLLDHGAMIAFGSDWFLAPPTPIEGLYAAVTRCTLDGAHPDGWVPEQRISLEQALVAYTRAGAFASYEEDRKGVLRAGLPADVCVLDRDLFDVPSQQLRDARVRYTVVGGRVVHQALRD